MERVVKTALDNMSIKNPQKAFIRLLLSVLVVVQGKANFRNMSRYCSMSEKRFSRWYRRPFAFYEFNTQALFSELPHDSKYIAAIDASFMNKSGKHTEGLGMFYHGGSSKAERGLELSLISVVHLESETAYALEAQQTIDQKDKSRAEMYADQVVSCAPDLIKRGILYLAADAFYAKKSFVGPVANTGLHIVGKLRTDADLYWLFTGEYSGRGRPKKYDGKVDFVNDLDRFLYMGLLDENIEAYTAKTYSSCLKRIIRVVLLNVKKGNKIGRVLLFSTDVNLGGMTLIEYYKARFQIEFVFRDAKQHTGLMDCQSRKKEAIHTHINASLSALNLLKLEDRCEKKEQGKTVISITSWKRRKFNELLMCRIFEELGLNLNDKKIMDTYKRLSRYGAIAA